MYKTGRYIYTFHTSPRIPSTKLKNTLIKIENYSTILKKCSFHQVKYNTELSYYTNLKKSDLIEIESVSDKVLN